MREIGGDQGLPDTVVDVFDQVETMPYRIPLIELKERNLEQNN